jgi:hypothetical protein
MGLSLRMASQEIKTNPRGKTKNGIQGQSPAPWGWSRRLDRAKIHPSSVNMTKIDPYPMFPAEF